MDGDWVLPSQFLVHQATVWDPVLRWLMSCSEHFRSTCGFSTTTASWLGPL